MELMDTKIETFINLVQGYRRLYDSSDKNCKDEQCQRQQCSGNLAGQFINKTSIKLKRSFVTKPQALDQMILKMKFILENRQKVGAKPKVFNTFLLQMFN